MHTDDLGGDSRDLRTRGIPDPAEAALNPADRETRIQRTDRRTLIGGATIIVGALIGSLSLAIATDGPTFHNPVSQMYGVLTLITVVATGGILIAVGATGRRQRLERAMMRRLMRKAHDTDTHLENISAAIDLIAEHMPEHDRLVNWRGYNAAIREGFVANTGTDNRHPSTGTRGKHLGLVTGDHDC